jgi:hypothetical protein
MPKYLIHRTVGALSDEQIRAAGDRSNDALAQMSGIRWIRSYYAADEGKIYCEYEALNLELLVEHARRAASPSTAPRSCASWTRPCSADAGTPRRRRTPRPGSGAFPRWQRQGNGRVSRVLPRRGR